MPSASGASMTSPDPPTAAKPLPVLLLLLCWSWVVMTVTHELGHVIGGIASGAVPTNLEIRPWKLPHSTFSPDPNPLMTLWAGPILGSVVPLLVACCLRRPAAWFIGWFCVVANAVYLLLGWLLFEPELDSTKMIRSGTPSYVLLLFVAMTLPVSYVAFRQQCVEVLSDPSVRISKRQSRLACALLCIWLFLQSVAGSLLHQ